MRVYNKSNMIPANTVLNTAVNSAAFSMYQIFGCAIMVGVTGTPAGNFKLQASCDPAEASMANPTQTPGPTNWADISGSTITVSSAGNIMWNVYDIMYTWIRVVYTDTSGGTSTATVTLSTINAKGA